MRKRIVEGGRVWRRTFSRQSVPPQNAAIATGAPVLQTLEGMSLASHWKYSIEDYVRLEEYSNVRHEFLDGRILAMAGGTPEHGARAAAVIAALSAQLRGKPCRVHTSDVRIRVPATGLDTYPDVSVVCGHAELDARDPNALTNPVVLVEVLSPSTEEYDRGEKLEHYKLIPSLQHVVLIAHERRSIEVVTRTDTGWQAQTVNEHGEATLSSIDCTLPLDDVFDDPLTSHDRPQTEG